MESIVVKNLIYFISSYIVLLLIYIFIINRKRKVYSEGKKSLEISYIVNKFNLDMRKIKYNNLKFTLTFINPLIMSITFIVVININNTLLSLLIGFIVMMLLVYSIYELIGRIYKKKCENL